LLFFTVFLLAGLVSAADVDPEVWDALEDDDKVSVIVVLKDDGDFGVSSIEGLALRKSNVKKNQDKVLDKLKLRKNGWGFGITSDHDFELKHRFSFVNGFSGKITKSGLEALQNDSNVEKIEINHVFSVSLDTSIPVIRADEVWNLSVGGIGLNGSGETVCVIDTGIDYNHASLGGGLGNKVLGGYDYYNGDSDPIDDSGHGTHVAGIIASTHSTYTGVAPEANLIAIKACDNTGGVCPSADIISGIEWCTNNATIYNISVISISLGGFQYTSYCDADFSGLASAINTAVGNNISVVISTGNTDGTYPNATGGIAAPACITNATRVTATNDADVLGSFAFRHFNFTDILAAPGVGIISTKLGGSTETRQGTSMAAPHVSGAIALLKQHERLNQNRNLTPSDAWNALNSTGVEIDDSTGSGINFSRIDVFSALMSVDDVAPVITFYEPLNNSYKNAEFSLNVSLTDTFLFASSYNITNVSGSVVQESAVSSINTSEFSWTDLVNVSNGTFVEGDYTLNVFVNDSNGNGTISNVDFIVDKTKPLVFGGSRTPTTVYNTDVVVFTVNTTDTNLNTSGVLLESNFSGSWINYTMVLEVGDKYNYSLVDVGNLTNQANISYRFYSLDLAGNVNSTMVSSFIVQNRVVNGANITSPANGTVIEVGEAAQFNGSANDSDGDLLIYAWEFGDGGNTAGQNVSKIYNLTGNYVVELNVSDSSSSNSTSIEVVVDDTQPPSVSSITFDSEVHIEQDGNQSVTATMFDYSNISDSMLSFSGDVKSIKSQSGSTYTWSWGGLSVGNYNFTINFTDNATVPHTNSSNYSFSVTSCSDNVENGNEGGVDCGGACDDSCSTSSSSSGSGGGGGAATATTNEEKDVHSLSSILPGIMQTINIDKALLSFTKYMFAPKSSASNVKITTEVVSSQDVPLLEGYVYQYIEISTRGISDDDLSSVTVEFQVNRSWLDENKLNEDTVKLNRYSDGWVALPTERVSMSGENIQYLATSPGFSVFAITAEPIATSIAVASDEEAEVSAESEGVEEQSEEGGDEQNYGLAFAKFFILATMVGVITVVARKAMKERYVKMR